MTLDERLAEGRGRYCGDVDFEVFDVAAAIAREAVAEKDAEIVRWRTWATEMPDYGWDLDGPIRAWYDDAPGDGEAALAQPRKVTDAVIDAIADYLRDDYADSRGVAKTIARIIEEKERQTVRARIIIEEQPVEPWPRKVTDAR
jgi:hypothetical protein